MCANANPKVSVCGSHLTPKARLGGTSPISRTLLGMARSASVILRHVFVINEILLRQSLVKNKANQEVIRETATRDQTKMGRQKQ